MEAAHGRDHDVYYLPKGGISLDQGSVEFRVQKAVPQRVPEHPLVLDEQRILSDADVDVIFIRPDPPFDAEYLMNTWLLDRVAERVVIVNKPSGVRTVNEKLWATQFSAIIPRTVVTRYKEDYVNFLQEEGEVIAKPTDGFGGLGVFHVRQGDSNTNVIFEMLSNNGRTEVIVQEYLPAAAEGDKRVLLLNGEYLGAVLRVHSESDHRNNFFAGGRAEEAAITEREREVIGALKPHLQRLGIYFAGIDLIGEKLVEVNVTSPTGIQEASHFAGRRLDEDVMDFVEELIEEQRAYD